jgi:hypothetical protein
MRSSRVRTTDSITCRSATPTDASMSRGSRGAEPSTATQNSLWSKALSSASTATASEEPVVDDAVAVRGGGPPWRTQAPARAQADSSPQSHMPPPARTKR